MPHRFASGSGLASQALGRGNPALKYIFSSVVLDKCVMGFVSATAADVVVTLPLAAAVRDGTLLVKKVFGAHTVRIVPQGADTIDGGVLVEIKELMAAFSLYSDGVTWHLI